MFGDRVVVALTRVLRDQSVGGSDRSHGLDLLAESVTVTVLALFCRQFKRLRLYLHLVVAGSILRLALNEAETGDRGQLRLLAGGLIRLYQGLAVVLLGAVELLIIDRVARFSDDYVLLLLHCDVVRSFELIIERRARLQEFKC